MLLCCCSSVEEAFARGRVVERMLLYFSKKSALICSAEGRPGGWFIGTSCSSTRFRLAATFSFSGIDSIIWSITNDC